MPHANLVLWVAGNQFFAANPDDMFLAFRRTTRRSGVGLITLPLNLLPRPSSRRLDPQRKRYRGRPASMHLSIWGIFQDLKRSGMMNVSSTYAGELQIMVRRAIQKITGIDDLVRDDVQATHQSDNEGIMQFYRRAGAARLWQAISATAVTAWPAEQQRTTWFTNGAHHRETPEHIATGQSDAGVVWRTEGLLQALRTNAAVDTIALPLPRTAFATRSPTSSVFSPRHSRGRRGAPEFLHATAGQDIYVKYGFVPAAC